VNLLGIITAVAVLVTASTIVIIYLNLENNIAQQNQIKELLSRVHAPSENGTRYVKISDLSPNSAFTFKYPYTENSTKSWLNTWILIRLPSKYGGDKNDISSFRAYNEMGLSALDIVWYQPSQEKLYELNYGNTYDLVNGTLIGGETLYLRNGSQTLPNALPNLDLGVDDQGYIYVKPPTFEIDKNGVIGLGRKVS
jgi:rieske iron-sulfur protein